MNKELRNHAQKIIDAAIKDNLPDEAVRHALTGREFTGNLYLIAIGKAAWQMAAAADECLGGKVKEGLVITKYDHSQGPIANYRIIEAGHPVSDENSYAAAQAAYSKSRSSLRKRCRM